MVATTTHWQNLTKPHDRSCTAVLSAKICQQQEQTEQMDLGKAWKVVVVVVGVNYSEGNQKIVCLGWNAAK